MRKEPRRAGWWLYCQMTEQPHSYQQIIYSTSTGTELACLFHSRACSAWTQPIKTFCLTSEQFFLSRAHRNYRKNYKAWRWSVHFVCTSTCFWGGTGNLRAASKFPHPISVLLNPLEHNCSISVQEYTCLFQFSPKEIKYLSISKPLEVQKQPLGNRENNRHGEECEGSHLRTCRVVQNTDLSVRDTQQVIRDLCAFQSRCPFP